MRIFEKRKVRVATQGILFILVTHLSWVQTDVSSLKMTLTTDKERYLVTEPVYLTITLENVGESVVVFPTGEPPGERTYVSVALSCVNPLGDTTHSWIYIGFSNAPMEPSEKRSQSCEILRRFGESIVSDLYRKAGFFGTCEFSPGIYSAIADLTIGTKGAIVGKLVSHTNFEVETPTSEEEEVLNLIKRGLVSRYWTSGHAEKYGYVEKGEEKQIWQSILYNYPESRYVPVVLSLSSRVASDATWNEKIVWGERLLEEYPDFGGTKGIASALLHFYYEIGNLEEGKQYLEQYIETYPESPIVSDIETTLE
ncbi:hypothetical protein KAX35_05200 [candidate division WOR-3 bacterium]|nr:hypothetical protein [candidate division WOR-3 bacterium]